ncbi:trypsin-like peptidase domain-containing protein [Streptomyces glomeratus]|uniref:trypsin-like peptidase domain-containing protein n=2 Tax=Streptomyces glomeratus TaxID=284452 RepID=UPI001F2D9414|nr:trypsin-like peptidase domain-containing protein [Streptomyces glomeratus]MCF1508015.1 trypsin-like peptidase domain-containing protein [Streptomyces glomeratus]
MSEERPDPAGGAEQETPEGRDGAGIRSGASDGGSGGDYELSPPVDARTRGEACAEGDFGPERPTAAVPPATSPGTSSGPSDSGAVSAGLIGGVPGAEEPAGGPDPEASADAPADRPRPLHDPDPYDTPPYGTPGPWAPAPPVGHPAAPPAPPVGHPAPPVGHPAPSVGHPAASPAPPVGHPAAPPAHGGHTPWQHYDPWAPRAPFQQNGARVAAREPRSGRLRGRLVLGAVLIALVSGGVGGAVGAALELGGGLPGDVRLPQAGKEPTGRAPDSVAGIAARALPSVVTLHVKGNGTEDTGTGFVLDRRGHILTNNHVVQPAGANGEISVTFNGGETAKATVVGRDTGYDLAVVRVGGVRGLNPLPLGNSDNVQVGDPVVAIGAPFDLAGTVTSGIISAKERPITAGGEKGDGSDVSYVDALQTDAPINPDNSGGPLLDARGRVVGINSAIRSADDSPDQNSGAGSIGLGFAIPVNQARRVAEELINTGRATHPVIGVTLDMDFGGDGARVAAKGTDGGPAVTPGGPGDRAGIRPGDVITEVEGARVHSGEELIVKTRAHRPGDRLKLTVVRDGGTRTITLVLGSANGS